MEWDILQEEVLHILLKGTHRNSVGTGITYICLLKYWFPGYDAGAITPETRLEELALLSYY